MLDYKHLFFVSNSDKIYKMVQQIQDLYQN